MAVAALTAVLSVTAASAHADEIRLLAFDAEGGASAYVAEHPEQGATNSVSGNGGSMVWVSCPADPPQYPGMTVLGASYSEVFADAESRSVYESVLPPGHFDEEGSFVQVSGEERRFGSFAGREEMQ